METDKIGFGKLLRESFTTPTLHRSLTLLVGNISRPPFPMPTGPIVVVGIVVKDSPRLRFDYHFESSERAIRLS